MQCRYCRKRKGVEVIVLSAEFGGASYASFGEDVWRVPMCASHREALEDGINQILYAFQQEAGGGKKCLLSSSPT